MASVPTESHNNAVTPPPSPAPTSFSRAEFIQTATQNYISRAAHIRGAPHLETQGKSIIHAGATVHGDRGARIRIGRYCEVGPGAVLMPSVVPLSNDPLATGDAARPPAGATARPGAHERALPLAIGSHTSIGPRARVHALGVGACVRVGADCVLGPRSRVHDCCIVEDGCHVPPDLVVPPFSRVRGRPGRIVGTLPECAGGEFVERRVQEYLRFLETLTP